MKCLRIWKTGILSISLVLSKFKENSTVALSNVDKMGTIPSIAAVYKAAKEKIPKRGLFTEAQLIVKYRRYAYEPTFRRENVSVLCIHR